MRIALYGFCTITFGAFMYSLKYLLDSSSDQFVYGAAFGIILVLFLLFAINKLEGH